MAAANNNGGGGPWGQRPTGGGGGGGRPGRGGPGFDDVFRKGQDRFKNILPGGIGSPRSIFLIFLIIIALWLLSGFYRVDAGERGIELLFGRHVSETGPGLHWWAPTPIGSVFTPNVERVRAIQIGFRPPSNRSVEAESLMITADQNIADVQFVVQWKVKDAADFLFNVRDPETVVKQTAESAMREVVGQTPLQNALTVGRVQVQKETESLMQSILDSYDSGILISEVKLQKVDPPQKVIDAFNDVQRARQDKERAENEARAYQEKVIPEARGEALKIVERAEAYKQQQIELAQGQAERFRSIFNEYRKAKDVTKRRLYLEAMESILKKADKIIVDENAAGQGGVVPYLPLPEVEKRRQGQ